MSRFDAFREAFRRAMATLPSIRNKGTVKPIRGVTPRRITRRSSSFITASGIEVTLNYPEAR